MELAYMPRARHRLAFHPETEPLITRAAWDLAVQPRHGVELVQLARQSDHESTERLIRCS